MIHPLKNIAATCLSAALLTAAAGMPAQAQRHGRLHEFGPSAPAVWVASWSAALTAPYGNETLPNGVLNNATLRETVHVSAGGSRIRVRLSNLFGEAPLVLRSVTVALPPMSKPDGGIVPATLRRVLFQGQSGVTITAGSEATADPLSFNLRPDSDMVLSLSIASAPQTPTLHAGARETEFLTSGDHASEAKLPGATTNTRWYFLGGVDVEQHKTSPAVTVAFGDSITDGHGATTDGNDRWPDDLFRRVAANLMLNGQAIVNKGIGGNCVLQVCAGPPATERFERDALTVPGVRTLIVLEGINDLGVLSRREPLPAATHLEKVQQLQAAFSSFIAQAHARGIRVIGATLTPWQGSEYYHPDAQAEADRTGLNTWIRTSGTFDDVVDFDAALRDPQHPDRMLPAYDSGDHLHPGPAGYQRMADTVTLRSLLTP